MVKSIDHESTGSTVSDSPVSSKQLIHVHKLNGKDTLDQAHKQGYLTSTTNMQACYLSLLAELLAQVHCVQPGLESVPLVSIYKLHHRLCPRMHCDTSVVKHTHAAASAHAAVESLIIMLHDLIGYIEKNACKRHQCLHALRQQ